MGINISKPGGGTTIIERSPFTKLYDDEVQRLADVLTSADEFKMAFQKDESEIYWIDESLNFVDYAKTVFDQADVKIIRSLDDLPAPVANVITIGPNENYMLTSNLDLGPNELRILESTSLKGRSQHTSRVTGSAASGKILSVEGNVVLQSFYMEVPTGMTGVFVDGSVVSTACDWRDMNFFGDGLAIHLTNVNNATLDTFGFLGISGILISGTINSLVVDESIANLSTAGDYFLRTDATAVVNGRIRLEGMSIIVSLGAYGIDLNLGSFPVEESILPNNINFSGDGEYTRGFDHKSLISKISNCTGVLNSTRSASIHYSGTPIKQTILRNVWYNPLIVSIAHSENQCFDHDLINNSLVYNRQQAGYFEVSCYFVSKTTSSARFIDVEIIKNGLTIEGATSQFLTNSGNRPVICSLSAYVPLEYGDVIEARWRLILATSVSIGVSNFNLFAKEV